MKTFLSPLSQAEEKYYVKQGMEGSMEGKSVRIERNMRLVAHIAKKYNNGEEDMEDLISIGTIGLVKAVHSFRENQGSKLSTYAAKCIENELLMYFRGKKKVSREVSLYEPIGTDKVGNQIHFFDIVEAKEHDIIEDMMIREKVKKIYEILPVVLKGREREIIIRRYGLYGYQEETQREIANRFQISRSYVSRIEKRALENLNKNIESVEKK